LHAFLCGHRGSGKSTELKRLCLDKEIQDKYLTLFLTAQDFGSEVVHLTHDALLVEIGILLIDKGLKLGMPVSLAEELSDWGKQVVTSFSGVFPEAASRPMRFSPSRPFASTSGKTNGRSAREVYNFVKKEYQPIICGEAVSILKNVRR